MVPPCRAAARPISLAHIGDGDASHLIGVLTLAVLASCNRTPPSATPELDLPARQFILEGLRLEERREGKLLWTGTARRADGDLASTEVEDITLVRPATEPGARSVTITAPKGTMQLDAGTARFSDVRVVDAQGGVLTATAAAYDGKAQRLDVAGPLEFHAQGLSASATSAVVQLDAGSMSIAGPVVGRFVKPPHHQP